MKTVQINGGTLTVEEFIQVVFHHAQVEISETACRQIEESSKMVADMVAKEQVVYGITTGFGNFSNVFISREKTKLLQRNLIVSHSTGVGDILPADITRGIMLLRLNALCMGFSGIRLSTLQLLKEFLNKNILPCIPQKGSVGSSGDLAPLSHMVLPMLGLGKAEFQGTVYTGADALARAGLKSVELEAKEGLALINGTQVMTSTGIISLIHALNLWHHANISAAMSLEALNGTDKAFDQKLHAVRPHHGQIYCAELMREIVKESEIIKNHKGCQKVQDAYSLRCIPQVHGASWNAFSHIEEILKTEMNSVTDNPLIFKEENDVISGGNFHGQPVALAMDYLGIAVSELANISERRVERLVNSKLSENLPAFLVEDGGLNSGFMITQYTAASLVSENKVLAHPASVDSIPTSASQEDHVSMGTIGAMKCHEIVKNTRWVLAIELMCAAQGLDFKKPLRPGAGTGAAFNVIRTHIPRLAEDRIMATDIEKITEIINSQEIVAAVSSCCCGLKYYTM